MADNTNSRIGRRHTVVSDITVAPVRMISQDIGNWVSAIDAARNTLNPRRRQLYNLYDNISADGKIITVTQKRKVAITNKDFVFYIKGKEGEPYERVQTEIIDQPWFDDMLECLEDEDFYGHTAFEIIPGTEYPIGGIEKIPNANIVPETGVLLINYMDDPAKGIPFRGEYADDRLKKYLMEFGKKKNYGLLLSMAQYVIYKRGGFGDWAQFAELFGMPFRLGKYDRYDAEGRNKLLKGLKEMGGSGYAVIPDGTSIEFPTTNYGSGQSGIFKDLVTECNSEIAQIGLGGTMTTVDGSSKSQSETHKQGENEITASRLKKILKFLNGSFKKRCIDHFGYTDTAEGYYTVRDAEVISLQDKILIDDVVSTKVKIHPEYWYKTYKVQAPESGPEAIEQQTVLAEKSKEKIAEKKKGKLSLQLSNYYKSSCAHCTAKLTVNAVELAISPSSDKEIERLAKQIYNGKLKTGQVDKTLLKSTAEKIMEGIFKGYLRAPGEDGFTVKDETLIKLMTEDVYVFSGFKTYQHLKEASKLLLDEAGNLKAFSAFKNDVLALDKTYNVTYLVPEYNLAVASGQMGSKWVGMQNNPDFKNWIYSTAGDDRVRPLHAALNKKVFEIGNPQTDTLWPPNDWGCRCDGDATDEAVNSESVKDFKQPGMFKNNVGVTGTVFPESHPYYNTSVATAKRITDLAKSLIPENGG